MSDPRTTRAYRTAVKNLRARGDIQACWRCGKTLYVEAKWPHPQCITLGHLIALEDGGDPYDPQNHAAECVACNMGDGARRTNRKRRGESNARHSYRSERW